MAMPDSTKMTISAIAQFIGAVFLGIGSFLLHATHQRLVHIEREQHNLAIELAELRTDLKHLPPEAWRNTILTNAKVNHEQTLKIEWIEKKIGVDR